MPIETCLEAGDLGEAAGFIRKAEGFPGFTGRSF
jgi:hypothetical protein